MFFSRILPAQAILPLLAALLLSPGAAEARPEMAGQNAASRFAAMDADKDGKLSREEFFAAQPNMKEAAFVAIDTDKDGFISAAEWEGFATDHGKSEAQMPQGHPPQGMGKDASGAEGASSGKDGGAAPSLLMPPAKR